MDFIGKIEDDEKIKSEREIVIYGTGKMGKKLFEILQVNKQENHVKAYCDSNKEKWGTSVNGKEVLSLVEASKLYPDAAYLVGSCCVRQMVEELQKYNIQKIHIARC